MRLIQKTDIVGARIIDVHESYELTDNGLDNRIVYFTVDRGLTFLTPVAGQPWATVVIPENAKRLTDYLVSQHCPPDSGWFGLKKFFVPHRSELDVLPLIKKQKIAGVYCGMFDAGLECHYPWDGTIVFEDGAQASNNMVAPHGTGSAGLYYHPANSDRLTPMNQLVDYFTIPLDKD